MCDSEYSVVRDNSSNLNFTCLTMMLLDLKKNPGQNSIDVGSRIGVVGLGKSPRINRSRAYAYFGL